MKLSDPENRAKYNAKHQRYKQKVKEELEIAAFLDEQKQSKLLD